MNELLDQIENDIGVSSIEDNLKSDLNHAIEKSRNVSQFILENAKKDPNLAGASSYNFLMMMGYLLG